MMHKIFGGSIGIDHCQFFLYDASDNPWEDMPDWTEEDNTRKGYMSNGQSVHLGTSDLDFASRYIEIYLSSVIPDFVSGDRVIAANIVISSGVLAIANPMNATCEEFEIRVDVKAGNYIAYIFVYNVGCDSYAEDDLTDEELEQRTDIERYKVVLVPGRIENEGVVKGEQYLY